jgi:shikimate dehydrogenase
MMAHYVDGTTKILAIIGHPISHSMSPLMQNACLDACNLNFRYIAFDVKPESLGDAVAGVKAMDIAGLNVTIPHKVEIMKYLDALDETALAAGAVNTVKNEGGRLIGYNTDGEGLIQSLAEDLGFTPEKRIILVIGAGGAARGAVSALCKAGASRILVLNRTSSKADELVSSLAERYPEAEMIAFSSLEEIHDILPTVDLVINATSLGMKSDDTSFAGLDHLPPRSKIYDMVYTPKQTVLMKKATELGLQTSNGLGMLSAQGELAFKIWTGVIPPSGLMRQVLSSICND